MMLLSEEKRDRMYSKRHAELINMPELAVKLNCKHEHIVAAQIGKMIPDDVYEAVVQWIGGE